MFLESLGRLNYLLKVRPFNSYLIFHFDLLFTLIYDGGKLKAEEKKEKREYIPFTLGSLKGRIYSNKPAPQTASLFKYVWPFSADQALKRYV